MGLLKGRANEGTKRIATTQNFLFLSKHCPKKAQLLFLLYIYIAHIRVCACLYPFQARSWSCLPRPWLQRCRRCGPPMWWCAQRRRCEQSSGCSGSGTSQVMRLFTQLSYKVIVFLRTNRLVISVDSCFCTIILLLSCVPIVLC